MLIFCCMFYSKLWSLSLCIFIHFDGICLLRNISDQCACITLDIHLDAHQRISGGKRGFIGSVYLVEWYYSSPQLDYLKSGKIAFSMNINESYVLASFPPTLGSLDKYLGLRKSMTYSSGSWAPPQDDAWNWLKACCWSQVWFTGLLHCSRSMQVARGTSIQSRCRSL